MNTQLVLITEPEYVAVVFDDEGKIYDFCFGWEAGQNYANAGFEVMATNDDRYMSMSEAQEIYDAERRWAAEFANFKVSSDGSTPFECAGHDFWLTRNGHGAGFWDRGLGDLGTRLAMSARAYGSQTLMLGHDGKIYN